MEKIDYAALVEKAKRYSAWNFSIRRSDEFIQDLANAIERLTQPGGEVEPVGRLLKPGAKGGEPVYSAAIVARLIAERDHAFEVRDAMQAQAKWLAEQNTDFETERDALQEQVKVLQDALREIEAPGSYDTTCARNYDICVAQKALAATEPKDKP